MSEGSNETRSKSAGILSVAAFLLAFAAAQAGAGEKVSGRRLVASSDGGRLAVIGDAGEIQVLDAEGSSVGSVSLGGEPHELAFSPDNAKLAACLVNGSVVSADLATRAVRTLESGPSCADLAWSKDSGRVFFVVSSVNRAVREPDEVSDVRMVGVASGERKTVHSVRLKSSLPRLGASAPGVPPVFKPAPAIPAPADDAKPKGPGTPVPKEK